MATYWVDNVAGDNGNTGGIGDPWETLVFSEGQLALGDTLNIVNTGVAWNGGFAAVVDGALGSEIIIQGEDPDNPPIISTAVTWEFDCSYRIVQDLIFDSFTDDAIDLGATGPPTAASFITIRRCIFRHANQCGVRIYYTEDVLIQDCWFIDLRKRVAGADLNSTQIMRTSSRVKHERCVFEDIGSDGCQINPNGYFAQNDHEFVDCVFYIHRPYALATRSWHDFSTNVGENGLDLKDCSDGDIDIIHCLFRGFQATVGGQDCSGDSGAGLRAHIDSDEVDIYRSRFVLCNRGATYAPGGGHTWSGGLIENCVFQSITDRALDIRAATHGLKIWYTTVEDSGLYLRLDTCGNATIELKNNFFKDGTFARIATTGEDCDYNGWAVDVGPDANWVGPNDPAILDDDLNPYLQPEADSDLLGAGDNLGVTTDLIAQTRPAPPAIGACELEQGATYAVYFDPDQLYLPPDAVLDSGDDLFLVPRPDGEWAICVRVADANPRYRHWDVAADQEWLLEFHVEPARLAMGANDRFVIARLQDGGVTVMEVELRYSAGYYIAVSAVDDGAVTHWVGTSSGFALGDNDKHKLTILLKCASRATHHDGACLLYIDDAFQGSVIDLDNDTFAPDDLDIGAISGIDATTGGIDDDGHFYLDPIILGRPGAVGGWQRHHPSIMRGTALERVAFSTTYTQSGTLWAETDTEDLYVWDGAAWDGPLATGYAPVDAEYVVMALNATLTDERVLTAGAGIGLVDGGAGGNATVSLGDHAHAGVAGDGGQLDWDDVWTDAVHTHANAAEGGQLDWDNVWADAIHLHTNAAEGGQLDHGAAMVPASLLDDDHTIYLLADGTRDLTGNLDVDDGVGNSPNIEWVGGGGGSGYIYYMDGTDTLAVYVTDNVAMAFTIRDKGAAEEYLTVVSTNAQRELVVNEDQVDIDFRVETDNDANTFRVDAAMGNIGIACVPDATIRVWNYEDDIANTTAWYHFRTQCTKATGASDHDDPWYGFYNYMLFNQVGGEVGYTRGAYNRFRQDNGDVGDAVNIRYLRVADYMADLNNDTVFGSVTGFYLNFDQEAAHTIGGAGWAYGIYLNFDAAGTVPANQAVMLYLNEVGGCADWAIYHNGAADSFLDGELTADKMNAAGGFDPAYVLYDAKTREEFLARYHVEVPQHKRDGAAMYFNKDTHQLEVYVASEGRIYDLFGKILEEFEPVPCEWSMDPHWSFSSFTGELVNIGKARRPRWEVKSGYMLDRQTGLFHERVEQPTTDSSKLGDDDYVVVKGKIVSQEEATHLRVA